MRIIYFAYIGILFNIHTAYRVIFEKQTDLNCDIHKTSLSIVSDIFHKINEIYTYMCVCLLDLQ